ncbi:uncharacterized protein LOC128987447 [Macrosteles quadrilineatus]|uniref:uncharacterized protein LOC128987447 n=1 Tax=Macrosteles quadrilineatus TaxID=74068 RepID=UPI0023E0A5E3|nr:uncharacterized protein LOC128987447 [Macrosteles quadrilineatus]
MKAVFALVFVACLCLASAYPVPDQKVVSQKDSSSKKAESSTASKVLKTVKKAVPPPPTTTEEPEPEKEIEMVAIIKNDSESRFFQETEEEASYQAEQAAPKKS